MGRFIPPGIEPHGGRGKAARLIVLACTLLLAAPLALFAQTGESLRTFHVPALSFNIPFGTDNDPRIVDVLLYVSTDGKTYNYVDTVRPAARKFFFSARQDGCYYFIVQTRDAGGALSPADLRGAQPSIRIYVDTHPPVIEELVAAPDPTTGLPSIRWKINEANLKDIRAEYRSVNGSEPLPLPLLPIEIAGKHTWKPHWGGELEVRMWAQDKTERWSQPKSARVRVADNVSGIRPPPETSKVMHVKSKTFQLDYKIDDNTIGPSRVVSVDIWKLYQGRGWQKCKETGKAIGPVAVTVESAGRWGFRLIPRSGAGLAERDPQLGDTPDIWVEVDDKPPQVKVTKVTVTQEGEDGYLTVYWTADDTYLRAMPITIWMKDPQAKDPQAPEWTAIASELSNTGNWRRRIDDLKLAENKYEFLLKVTAVDEADNLGSNIWGETVKLDLKIPRIKSIEVKPGGAASSDGQEARGATRMTPGGSLPGIGVPPPGSGNYPGGHVPASPTNGLEKKWTDPGSRGQ